MDTKNFIYLCDKEFSSIPEILKNNYIKTNHLKEIGFEKSDVVFDNESLLIIFEPLKIGTIYYSVYKIWKRYYNVKYPSCKIIVAGFIKHQSPNYLDLLNLPGDFQTLITNALRVGDDWKIPVECADLLEKMRHFFEGHGPKSLLSQLNKIIQSIEVVTYQLVSKESSFKEICESMLTPYFIPELNELKMRWEKYYPFFRYLPFFPKMESIDRIFKHIFDFFKQRNISENDLLDQQFDEKCRLIYKELTNIDKLYIRPEIYNEK